MTTTHSIRAEVRGASWLEVRGLQALDPFDRLELGRTLIRVAGKPIVEERTMRHAVSFALAGSTAIVTSDSIAILACSESRLDRAASYALANDPEDSVRYVRIAGESEDKTRIGQEMSSLAAIRSGGVVIGESFVAFSSGRGFSSVSHLRVPLGEAHAQRISEDPSFEIRSFASLAGVDAPLVHDHGYEPVGYSMNLFTPAETLAVLVRPDSDGREAKVLVRDASDERAEAIALALGRWAQGSVTHVRVDGDDRRRASY